MIIRQQTNGGGERKWKECHYRAREKNEPIAGNICGDKRAHAADICGQHRDAEEQSDPPAYSTLRHQVAGDFGTGIMVGRTCDIFMRHLMEAGT